MNRRHFVLTGLGGAVALRVLHRSLGIDGERLRLSWILESSARNAALLAAGKGDLWDSGKVNSGESIQIAQP